MIHLCLALISLCSTPADLWDQGLSEFRAGANARANEVAARQHFCSAAQYFADLRILGANSASLHRNEGKARILSGDVAGAILAFQRGLANDPNDADLQKGLAYARSQVDYISNDDRQRFTPRPSGMASVRRALARFGVLVLAVWTIVSLIMISRWLVSGRSGQLWFGIAFLAVAFLWSRAIHWATTSTRDAESLAVVTTPTFLREGNGNSFPERISSKLPAGVEVRICNRQDGWRQVQLSDGTIGWLPATSVDVP
jgi:hypothetical protein